jgi:hypothetical protein|tara:strand:- start:51 stop:494 length:444 start_codon:yes stop_codon:yes gene_type:complete
MAITDILLVIAAIILAWIVFKFVTQIIVKIIVFLMLVIFSYSLYQTYTSSNIILEFKAQFCDDSQEDSVNCDCIVTPIFSDLNERFTTAALDSLQSNNIESIKELYISLDNKREEITNCFIANGKGDFNIEDLIEKLKNLFFNKNEN